MSRALGDAGKRRKTVPSSLFSSPTAALLGVDAGAADTSVWSTKELAQENMDLLTELHMEKFAALPAYIRDKSAEIKRFLPMLSEAYRLATDFLDAGQSASVERWMNPQAYDFPHDALNSRRLDIESISSVADLLTDTSWVADKIDLDQVTDRSIRLRLQCYIRLRLAHPEAFSACLSGKQMKLLRGLEEYWQRTDRTTGVVDAGVREQMEGMDRRLRAVIAEYENQLAAQERQRPIQGGIGGPEMAALFENRRQLEMNDLRLQIATLKSELARLTRVSSSPARPTPWYAAALRALTTALNWRSAPDASQADNFVVSGKEWPDAVSAWDRGIIQLQPRASEEFARSTEALVRVYESIVMRTMESLARQAFSMTCLAPLEEARSLVAGKPMRQAIRAACKNVFQLMAGHVERRLTTGPMTTLEDLHPRHGSDMVVEDMHESRRLCARQVCIAKIWSNGTHRFEAPAPVDPPSQPPQSAADAVQALLRATLEMRHDAVQSVARSVVWREMYDTAALDFTMANPRYLAETRALREYIRVIWQSDSVRAMSGGGDDGGGGGAEIMGYIEDMVARTAGREQPVLDYASRWASHYVAVWYSALEDYCMSDAAISKPARQFELVGRELPLRPAAVAAAAAVPIEPEIPQDSGMMPVVPRRGTGEGTPVPPPRGSYGRPLASGTTTTTTTRPPEFDALRAREAQSRYLTRIQRIIQIAADLESQTTSATRDGALRTRLLSVARTTHAMLTRASQAFQEAFNLRLEEGYARDQPSAGLPIYAEVEYEILQDMQSGPQALQYARMLDELAQQISVLEQTWLAVYRRLVDDRGVEPSIFQQLASAWSLVPYVLYGSERDRDAWMRDSNLRYSVAARNALPADTWSATVRAETVMVRDEDEEGGGRLFYEPYAFYQIDNRWLLCHQLLMPETVHFAARVLPLRRHSHSFGIALKTTPLYRGALRRALNATPEEEDDDDDSVGRGGTVAIVALGSMLMTHSYRAYEAASMAALKTRTVARPAFRIASDFLQGRVGDVLNNNPVTRYLELPQLSTGISRPLVSVTRGEVAIEATTCMTALLPSIRALYYVRRAL